MNKRTRYILFSLGSALVIFLAWYFSAIVSYIFISAIIATMGRPLNRWLQKMKYKKFHLSASVCSFITLVTIWVFFFGFFIFIIPLLMNEFQDLMNIDINEYLKEIEQPISQISMFLYGKPISFSDPEFVSMLSGKVASFFKISQLTDVFGTIAGTVGRIMIGIFSVSFITFFFLREEAMFRDGLMLLVPTEYEDRVSKSLDHISYLLRRYFIGIALEVILVGGLEMLGLTIIGMKFSDAIVIGVVCGMLNVIPYLGPWIGSSIGVLIGIAINIEADFMDKTLPFVGLMLIVFVIVHLLDNIIFQPLIYSSSVKAHPLEIFLVILAAGSVAGILGMVLAIPVYTIFRVFGAEFLSNLKIIRKITEGMEKRT